ncbi:zinc ribbon domain-containing protein [Desulfonema ishimotonii]|uniref:Zinc ribbon domain-containing protein n=1 Tax=Desulfonema ishimotonii TaxID=45657 RepID=A0A401FU28_9BACT|nr:zinc ribbon domain-containing protein [Desulfonema ishimotonii]GBC60463.1 zinc ribbon domain-containing protein [Desulfonema ishimotonii]
MPKYEYNCPTCGHYFEKIAFMGDEDLPVPCPECGRKEVRRLTSAAGLFNGIANFSALAKDHS